MNVPAPIASFFHAFNAKDTDALLASFAPDALVTDEEHEYRGLAAIKGWFATVNAKYKPSVEATDLADNGGEIVVTTQVSGTFPGSPIRLHYHFTLKDGRVAALSIGN
jgi:ketosteroid isomerase-like protein